MLGKCLGFNIFPSEDKMRGLQPELTYYLKTADIYVSHETLVEVSSQKKLGKVAVLRCKDLTAYMECILKEYKQKALIGPGDAQKRVDLLFSGEGVIRRLPLYGCSSRSPRLICYFPQ